MLPISADYQGKLPRRAPFEARAHAARVFVEGRDRIPEQVFDIRFGSFVEDRNQPSAHDLDVLVGNLDH